MPYNQSSVGVARLADYESVDLERLRLHLERLRLGNGRLRLDIEKLGLAPMLAARWCAQFEALLLELVLPIDIWISSVGYSKSRIITISLHL